MSKAGWTSAAGWSAMVSPPRASHETDRAYVAGRRDERKRRGFSPLVGFLLLLVIAIGAVLIYLAVTRGSFSAGGAVVDNSLSTATAKVAAPVHNAADKAGDALQNAGSNLKQTAGSGNPN